MVLAIGRTAVMAERRVTGLAAEVIGDPLAELGAVGVGPVDRDRFRCGKNKQNAIEALLLADQGGWMLSYGATRVRSCADIAQARQAGSLDLFGHRPLKRRAHAS